jgi:hypothetical protein
MTSHWTTTKVSSKYAQFFSIWLTDDVTLGYIIGIKQRRRFFF